MHFLYFLLLLGFAFSDTTVAEIDQRLIDNVYQMTSPVFKKGTDEISRPVQTINMLAHELSLYDDDKANKAAKSIISMVAMGEGVKDGLRKSGHQRRFMNQTERVLVIDAITKAADYLQRRNLLDDFLKTSMATMTSAWGADRTANTHGSIVLSLLLAAREKTTEARPDLGSAKVHALGFIPDGKPTITDAIHEDRNWHYAKAYIATPKQAYHYNSIELEKIKTQQADELAKDTDFSRSIQGAFSARALTPTTENIRIINGMADELEKTVISEKAALLTKQIMDSLKNAATDLGTLITDREGDFRKAVIRALVAVEKFRAGEIKSSGLERTNPSVSDYLSTQNDQTKAILVALVSAIQNYLYNPSSTVDSLKKLFSYKINDQTLEALGGRLTKINPDDFINTDLIEILSKPIEINSLQKIIADQEILKQKLRFFWMPAFDKVTGEIAYNPTFVRYYGSGSEAMQCGFFSLGFESRRQAKQQIVDNLKDPEIFAIADRISATSAEIKRLLDRLEKRSRMSAAQLQTERDSEIQKEYQTMAERLTKKQEKKKRNEITNEASIRKKGLIKELEESLKQDPELLGIEDSKEKEKKTKEKIAAGSKEIDGIIKDGLTAIAEEVGKAVDEETESKKAEILAETQASIILKETRDDAATETLLEKIKAHQRLATKDDALKAEVLRLYEHTKARIAEEKRLMDGEVDRMKREAGFPEKNPDDAEVALWIMIHEKDHDFKGLSEKEIIKRTAESKAELSAKLQELSRSSLTFPINHMNRAAFKRIVGNRFDVAESMVTRVTDTLRTLNTRNRTKRTMEIDSIIVKEFYSLKDFQEIVWQDMHNVFAQKGSGKIGDVGSKESDELLEFPPSPEWKIDIFNYPLLMAKLNNYNIGAWTSKAYLRELLSGRVETDKIQPIYQTENDGEYALVSYISTTEDAKRVNTVNLGGGHFEKIIEASDGPQAIRALRHLRHVGLANTRAIPLS